MKSESCTVTTPSHTRSVLIAVCCVAVIAALVCPACEDERALEASPDAVSADSSGLPVGFAGPIGDIVDVSNVVVPGGCSLSSAVFRPLPWVTPKPDILSTFPLSTAELLTSESAFLERTGVMPPSVVDFSQSSVLLVVTTENHFPEQAWVEGIVDCGDIARAMVRIYSTRRCASLDSRWDAYGLFVVDVESVSSNVEFDFQVSDVELDCGVTGATSSESCSVGSPCAAGAICGGLTESPTGVCVPEGMRVVVENSVAAGIPDDDPEGYSSTNTVEGLGGQISDVVVQADVDHVRPQDLTVTLQGPSGKSVVVWSQDAPSQSQHLARPAPGFAGQDPNGTWKLTVVDLVPGNAGELDRWKIEIVTVP